MVRTTTAILLVWFITTAASAQKAELLKGKWEFKDIANKEKLDTIILKQAMLAFAKTQIEFMADGKLSYNPLGNNQFSMYKGTWVLNKEQTKVSAELTHPSKNNSNTVEWEIKGLTENELKLDMGNNAVIAFCRPPTAPVTAEKKVEEPEKIVTPKNVEKNEYTETKIPKNDLVADPTEFVAKINDYNVFKIGSYYGLKNLDNKIVFPAILSSIKQGLAGSFDITISGKYIEMAYFGPGRFTGQMACDVCDGSGYVESTFHISGDRKVSVSNIYLGNGIWKEVTTTIIIPPYDAKGNTSCKRCQGLGMMKGGVYYVNDTIKIWYWIDELNKHYKN